MKTALATTIALTLLLTAVSAQTLAPLAARLEKERDNAELQKIAPFKVFDNLFYVGVGWVASWLVPTSEGLILIDSLEERYVDHLLNGVSKLGFDPKNIRHVIVLQAHFDHFGGAALIQENYGAQVAMGEEDWNMLARQPPAGRGGARIRVPRRDRAVRDGDTLTLGDTTLKLYSTPGHTPGTTSIEMTVYDNGRPHRAFFFGGSAPAAGARAAEQFLGTVKRLETMEGLEVRIPNHPFSDPEFWKRVDTLATRRPGDPHPFVEPTVFAPWFQQLKSEAEKQLATAPRQ